MEKEYIPFKQTVKLQKMGYNEPSIISITRKGLTEETWNPAVTNSEIIRLTKECNDNRRDNDLILKKKDMLAAVLYQQAFRWFREKYKLHSTITSISQESWQFHITKQGQKLGELYEEDFYNYEEAEFACLKRLIKLI
jgi:hypothetical protein